MTAHRPLIIAHRGGFPQEPDNSAAAFQHAITVGADGLECDVRRTADGILVLTHDEAIRVNGRRIQVPESSFASLRDAMPWLLTLPEFLEAFGQKAAILNVDLKARGFEAEVLDLLRQFAVVERTVISTTSIESLRKLASLEPGLRLGLSRGQWVTSVPSRLAREALAAVIRTTLPLLLFELRFSRATAIMLQHAIVAPGLVARLHQHGYRVFAWTVDDALEARRVAAARVDGIATDVPGRIMAALAVTPSTPA
ncbi:glycerophosphodiester phosphodiesterase [Nitrolancea hollandica]|uniref:Glycerophosphoryl diester phosphodiesterase n=1 Tax=Nitrolancea hollandica Lb TaxID=1129897 RepID=I4EDT8_9BACT|nr:glycerophosphodiester phosphodiesterase [Nitrolancea hollandica]CCF82850.1 Glycerophosphoryl diester phosphodiesterase [Nitrolancea hollandica Lb]